MLNLELQSVDSSIVELWNIANLKPKSSVQLYSSQNLEPVPITNLVSTKLQILVTHSISSLYPGPIGCSKVLEIILLTVVLLRVFMIFLVSCNRGKQKLYQELISRPFKATQMN